MTKENNLNFLNKSVNFFERMAGKIVRVYRPGKAASSSIPSNKRLTIQAVIEIWSVFFSGLFMWGLIREIFNASEFIASTLTFIIMSMGMASLAFIHIERDRQRILLIAEKQAGIKLEQEE